MLRKNLNWLLSQAGRTSLCCSAALALTIVVPNVVSYQDVAHFAGKTLGQDRWLASIVAEPSPFVHDPALSAKAEPIILNAEGALISDNDISNGGEFKGYAFARTPQIARLLSQKTVVSRSDKGDLPVSHIQQKTAEVQTHALFAHSALFSAPNESLWPSTALSGVKVAPKVVARKQVRPATKTAKKIEDPLVLVPNAAIAAIAADAEEQANTEIDQTVTASLGNISSAQSGYAQDDDDPRAVFEAVLARRDGKAKLPDAPVGNGDTFLDDQVQEVTETPLAVTLEDAVGIPSPRIKPEVVARLDPSAKKSNKKQHFWAAFKLPRSTYKKTQQRCLAAGIYFESRGEVEKGQAAVAQVILNRVKAPTYPNTICGVVYQNKHWRNRCQFSFACDGVYDRVNDKKAWDRAVRIARDVSKGKIYLDKVADSTHYHATYVKPRWRKKMKVVDRIGIHIFYRTKNGGWS